MDEPLGSERSGVSRSCMATMPANEFAGRFGLVRAIHGPASGAFEGQFHQCGFAMASPNGRTCADRNRSAESEADAKPFVRRLRITIAHARGWNQAPAGE
ncbi:hypothetical protein FGO68_gene14631 [Halteria grandinella]|uniref:Uncharacterized protein n=1 Tax=Halteria grandinella TaxID=5974 RepID=A0A8J8NI30_HALGN|nr:hypothetical protein FGO68_gene14631 [Halteria grandinella]